jgi:hypothetical protein
MSNIPPGKYHAEKIFDETNVGLMSFFTFCSVFGKSPSPALENYTLADMAFLSALSYRSSTIVESQLEGWFGPSGWNVSDEFEYVNRWKLDNEGSENKNAVFRLFRFPSENGSTGIVSVRGTAGSLDLLVDNQLWQAAMLAQVVRLALPFGEIFTPILPGKS